MAARRLRAVHAAFSIMPFTLLRSLVDNGTLTSLGPGLITGAADHDPSGIATHSQAGAQLGFDGLWTLMLTWPFMVGIQFAIIFIPPYSFDKPDRSVLRNETARIGPE